VWEESRNQTGHQNISGFMKNSNELWWYWVKVIEGEQYYTHTLVNAAGVIKVLASTSASQVNFQLAFTQACH
jgi:hypothetical protein